MQSRRNFLKTVSLGSGLLASNLISFESIAAKSEYLTILHTNDVHSRLDPFPDGKFAGQGGVAARAALISKIRKEKENILLLDAGDIFQGTPYFNLYKGEPEIKAMTYMGYDACTMGNHDFDAGIENFANQLHHADFLVLVANYDFTETPFEHKTQPYKIFRKGNVKIGVFGLGIELKGLVPDENFAGVKYQQPIEVAKKISEKLKKGKSCDLVICLSHLGFSYDTNKVSDKIIAAETEYIDIIIGGHTHTFLDQPVLVKNKIGNDVIINQVGWAGLNLGHLDLVFSGKKVSLQHAASLLVH